MCALETAALEITSQQAESSGPVTKETIEKCIESLEDEGQKDFIRKEPDTYINSLTSLL